MVHCRESMGECPVALYVTGDQYIVPMVANSSRPALSNRLSRGVLKGCYMSRPVTRDSLQLIAGSLWLSTEVCASKRLMTVGESFVQALCVPQLTPLRDM